MKNIPIFDKNNNKEILNTLSKNSTMEKLKTFGGNSTAPPNMIYSHKRQSKTLPGTTIESIQILPNSEIKKPDLIKNETFLDCDFDEPDRAIGVTEGMLKNTLSITASKNKNFSNHFSIQNFDEGEKERDMMKMSKKDGPMPSANDLKKVESSNCNNENDEHFITEIQKDYETILSKDLDFEETLNNMEVISISSMDNTADFEESPNIGNKIPNAFSFENAAIINKKNNNDDNNGINEKMFLSGLASPGKSPRTKKKSANNSMIQNHPFRTLIFSPYVSEAVFMKHLLQTYKGLVYAKKCLKVQISEYQREKSVNLKEKKGNRYKTLFLDLDETLIHACSISENPQHIIKGTGPYGSEILIGFNVRPYCLEFLKKLSQFYEIVIFTASMSNYAHAIVNFLDPYHQYISEVLTRSSCIRSKNGFFIKDLRIIKNRELKNMMIVDNLSHSFGFQIDNGIPILEFLNDKKDRELKHIYDHLLEGLYVDDVRVFNRKKLQLNLLSEMRIEDLRIL